MYLIINRKFVVDEVTNEKIGSICDAVCDNYEDIPTADDIKREKMLTGSWLWIINAKNYLVLNKNGGYILTHTEPKNWESEYTNYFIKSNNSYIPIPIGENPPEWEEDKYYYYTNLPSFV